MRKTVKGIALLLLISLCLSSCGLSEKSETAKLRYSTVSATVTELAETMPEVSLAHLPNWKGHTVAPPEWKYYATSTMSYQREEIKVLHDLGFNFVRAPLNAEHLFESTDTSVANEAAFEAMDRLIEYCAEEGLHLCFDLHDMPGFYTNSDDSRITLWDNPEEQQFFVDFWRYLAERYQDVSPKLLSFNLLNEPHSSGEAPSDEQYSELMKRAISAIHAITPDRLIFVDTLGTVFGSPVEGLIDAQVVQTLHPYFLPSGTSSWPSNSINGFIHSDNGVFTLEGSFPSNTVVTIEIRAVHGTSEFSLLANGATITSLQLGHDAVGENGCTYLGEEGTTGEFRYYEDTFLTGTLPVACTRLQITQTGGVWYNIRSVSVKTDAYTVEICENQAAIPNEDEVPVLKIEDDGTVSALSEQAFQSQSKEWLETVFIRYHEFSEQQGVPFMVQEFGFDSTIPYAVASSATGDLLSVLDEYNIPWCSWLNEFGPVLDAREVELYKNEEVPLTREGSEYEKISDNWIIDTGLMRVFHSFM